MLAVVGAGRAPLTGEGPDRICPGRARQTQSNDPPSGALSTPRDSSTETVCPRPDAQDPSTENENETDTQDPSTETEIEHETDAAGSGEWERGAACAGAGACAGAAACAAAGSGSVRGSGEREQQRARERQRGAGAGACAGRGGEEEGLARRGARFVFVVPARARAGLAERPRKRRTFPADGRPWRGPRQGRGDSGCRVATETTVVMKSAPLSGCVRRVQPGRRRQTQDETSSPSIHLGAGARQATLAVRSSLARCVRRGARGFRARRCDGARAAARLRQARRPAGARARQRVLADQRGGGARGRLYITQPYPGGVPDRATRGHPTARSGGSGCGSRAPKPARPLRRSRRASGSGCSSRRGSTTCSACCGRVGWPCRRHGRGPRPGPGWERAAVRHAHQALAKGALARARARAAAGHGRPGAARDTPAPCSATIVVQSYCTRAPLHLTQRVNPPSPQRVRQLLLMAPFFGECRKTAPTIGAESRVRARARPRSRPRRRPARSLRRRARSGSRSRRWPRGRPWGGCGCLCHRRP